MLEFACLQNTHKASVGETGNNFCFDEGIEIEISKKGKNMNLTKFQAESRIAVRPREPNKFFSLDFTKQK